MKLYVAASLILFASCSKLIVSNTCWKPKDTPPVAISGTDKKSNISWKLANDSSKLYLSFQVTEHDVQMSVIHDGFTLHFDTEGKKGKMFSVSFRNKRGHFPQIPHASASYTVGGQYTMLVWQKYYEDALTIDLEFEKSHFSCSYLLDTSNVLTCYAMLPFSAFDAKTIKEVYDLNICIDTKPAKTSSPDGTNERMENINGVDKPRDYESEADIDDYSPARASVKKIELWFKANLAQKP